MAKNNNPSYEEVFWKVESKDIQIHGIDKPKIVSQIEIEGVSSSWGWSETLSFIRPASTWTWTQSFSWFSFTPTRYDIVAWRSWDATGTGTLLNCHSICSYSSTWAERGMRVNPNWALQSECWTTTSLVRVLYSSAWWGQTRASHSSLNSDWITLNFIDSAEDIDITITVYS